MSSFLFIVICLGLLAAVMLETVSEELGGILQRLLDRLHGHKDTELPALPPYASQAQPAHRMHQGGARHVHRGQPIRHNAHPQPSATSRDAQGQQAVRTWH